MSLTLIDNVQELKSFRRQLSEGLGVVMTMGNLHRGHLSLIETSLEKYKSTLVTIFVNPLQFGPSEDFHQYPRTLAQDLKSIESLVDRYSEHQITVFAPQSVSEIYPENFRTSVRVMGLTEILCGQSRPTHFEGVTTVVCRLLGLTQPDCAFFGQKDYQQFKVIERMVQDLALPCKLQCCPIVRDHDGLALSSRNAYLSSEQRYNALLLPKTLTKIQQLITDGASTQVALEAIDEKDQFEYLEIRDANTLTTINDDTRELVVLGALKVGATRLIDNLLMTRPTHA